MGEASMRKWMRRADAAYERDRGAPMLWPYQSDPRRARALYLRRLHRHLRQASIRACAIIGAEIRRLGATMIRVSDWADFCANGANMTALDGLRAMRNG